MNKDSWLSFTSNLLRNWRTFITHHQEELVLQWGKWTNAVKVYRTKHLRAWQAVSWVTASLAVCTTAAFLFFFWLVIAVKVGFTGELASRSVLSAIRHNTASEVYAIDSSLLGKYFIENRTTAQLSEMSPWLIHALIATEDTRFYEHGGVDIYAWGRVFWRTILLNDRSGGGGSTITQQLAKNLYGRRSYAAFSTPINKIREIIIAQRLEEIYDKPEILALYLNTVPFGDYVFGAETASQRYFGKSCRSLTPTEAATLVGMLKATSRYHPIRNPERSRSRRNMVLALMQQQQRLGGLPLDSLMSTPLQTHSQSTSHHDGMAPYFREHLRSQLEVILEDIKKKDGTSYNLYTDGLRIYTSIDPVLQSIAEAAVHDQMKELQATFEKHWKKESLPNRQTLRTLLEQDQRYQQLVLQQGEAAAWEQWSKPQAMTVFTHDGLQKVEISRIDSLRHVYRMLHAGFLSVDPQSGNVLAWVGGIDHRHFQYDHVLSRRQVGSVFKPVVYAAALQAGLHPCDYFTNELHTYTDYEDWQPRNANGEYEGAYSMSGALCKSINTISVQLAMQAGLPEVCQLAADMGITSDIPAVPSVALGTAELSLWEVVQMYSTLANQGVYQPMRYLLRIENAQGKILYENSETSGKRVLGLREAQIITALLQDVVQHGTARRLRYHHQLKGAIAGKTGTTQSHADGWFVGYTPSIVAGAWVGGSYPQVRFRSLSLGQGARTALPIFGNFMKAMSSHAAFADQPYAGFEIHDSLIVAMDCDPYVDIHPDSTDYLFSIESVEDVLRIFNKRKSKKTPRTDRERRKTIWVR